MDGLRITFQESSRVHDKHEVTTCTPVETNFLPGETRRIICREGTVGRYVRIEVPGFDKSLILCEVEIYEYKPIRMYFFISHIYNS